jgi:hypothetical protein
MTMGKTSTLGRGIEIYPGNPYYWQYDGKPVLLLGGSMNHNLFQLPHDVLTRHLDTMVAVGANYVRSVMSSRDEGEVWPFAKGGRGYDLSQWEPEHWRRLSILLEETKARNIIVQIELWCAFDYCLRIWDRNPFNPKNNLNYTAEESGLPTEFNERPWLNPNRFFWSVPAEDNVQIVLQYQQRLVDEILAHSLQYDHVLYCMDNEIHVSPEWGWYWARRIQEAAAKRGRRAHTTEMWGPWDLSDPMHDATIEHPEIYDFVEVSQNNQQKGQTHYDNLLQHRRRIAASPRPLNNVKVYGADGGPHGVTRDGVERFWRNIFAGAASARFHRPESGLGLSDIAQRSIAGAREVTGTIDLFRCEPRPDLLCDEGLEARCDNRAYCLANPDQEYAVYLPDGGGDVMLDLGGATGDSELRWYHIDAGRWDPSAGRLQAGGTVRLRTPGPGQWVAVVRR